MRFQPQLGEEKGVAFHTPGLETVRVGPSPVGGGGSSGSLWGLEIVPEVFLLLLAGRGWERAAFHTMTE